TIHPKATEEIPYMIDMIDTLIHNGHAYPKNGTVYFRTRSFGGYGKLSGKNLDDLRSGFRDLKVSGEDEKEDPLDFVLWKPKKEGEPFWESPWCNGRPGWHIECSVMSKRYLGEQIDIHAGGEDLIFPHHENEIAQSECASGKEFARYWMHNAFLNIDNKKMSKSLGNFFTVRDISEKYDLQVLRLFMLSAHYRSPLNFSAELMEAAGNSLERIRRAAGRLKDLVELNAANAAGSDDEKKIREIRAFVDRFDEKMDDDANTADALSVIFDLVRYANINVTEESSEEVTKAAFDTLTELCDILGIIALKKEEVLDSDIEAMIEERQAARKARDFAKADEIRDRLKDMGIVLMDTKDGVKWSRK
ncbi:MAG: cysteine--tRNA ligase, partial [Lachnospiraceae bacterium]|nr:cysteine--tRNA ligase [Lachnospiraceae bacterium]